MSIKNAMKDSLKEVDTKKVSFNVKMNEYDHLINLLEEYNYKLAKKKLTMTKIINELLEFAAKELEKELKKGELNE